MSPTVAQMHLTRTGIRIGIARIPLQRIEFGRSAILLQSALLDPRTAQPIPALRRIAAAIYKFL